MSSGPPAKGPRRPVRIGKYEVLAHIASGGMAAVYRARDTESGREVALKVLSPQMAAKPAMLERFRREARAAAKLRHENIVTVYEFGEAGGTCYLAMELIDGIDLLEYSDRKGPLDPEEARQILVQACRALAHAHAQEIVHRDVKPSNFLIARQGGRPVVKMTDLGLAREAAEEYRVTRIGTTVGTLDYMAPEQARDSGTADVRSDLYSLGCTWYHLLAGQAPFPQGSLAERLYKIMNEEPPDVRQFNPRVPAATAAVLERLLAKDPGERHQTPDELLADLLALEGGGRPSAVPALPRFEEPEPLEEVEPSPPARRSHGPRLRAAPGPRGADTPPEQPAVLPAERPSRLVLWLVLAGVGALLLLALGVGLAVALALGLHRPPPAPAETSPPADVTPPARGAGLQPAPPGRQVENLPHEPAPVAEPPTAPGEGRVLSTRPAPQPPTRPAALRPLYQPDKPIDAAALRREVEAPWARPAARAAEPALLRLSRLPGAGAYTSLAAAFAAAPADRPAVIEVRDNGPLFVTPAAAAGRRLAVRAAKGYRPLLVWDVARSVEDRERARQPLGADGLALFAVRGGALTLEGIDVVLKSGGAASGPLVLLQGADGDLAATDCTFTAVGQPRGGVVLARLRGDQGGRCRFTRCHARGSGLTALDADAAGAEVLFDGCLVVGGEGPLFQVRAESERAAHLRVVRSTFVGGGTLVQVRPTPAAADSPAFTFLGWDALLGRTGGREGGALLEVANRGGTRKMDWRAYNCLYAGWPDLLVGTETISATEDRKWRIHWQRAEGDEVLREPWPAGAPNEPGEAAAAVYKAADTPAAFASSTAPDRPLGCDLAALPPAPENWLPLCCESAPAPQVDALPGGLPEVPAPGDDLYHGGAVNLDQVELGDMLERLEKSGRVGPKVVLHLSGKGEHAVKPIRLKGKSLVLYVAPVAEGAAALTLTPAGGPSAAEALVELDGGSLDVIGANLRLPEGAAAGLPYLLKVRGGDLRLSRCRLEGPRFAVPDGFRGLVCLEGSGDPAPDAARRCSVSECLLESGRAAAEVRGVGARLVLRQSLLVSGADALRFLPGDALRDRASVGCLLERVTIAAKGAAVRLGDAPQAGVVRDPVVLQTLHCAFLNPFMDRPNRAGLLLAEGDALAHGLLVWQSDGDVYDRRLHYGAAAAGALPARAEPFDAWARLWGTNGVRGPGHNVPFRATLDLKRWPLDRLAVPGGRGADIAQLPLPKPKPRLPR
jgi:eukaryotic-like serine/threonine-protein kinase